MEDFEFGFTILERKFVFVTPTAVYPVLGFEPGSVPGYTNVIVENLSMPDGKMTMFVKSKDEFNEKVKPVSIETATIPKD